VKEIIDGKFHEDFPIDMMQGGAGTSVNMNANEVIANRALEIMGHKKGEYQYCYPNDHVNCGQSTNDVYPTSIRLALIRMNKNLVASLTGLISGYPQLAKGAIADSRSRGGAGTSTPIRSYDTCYCLYIGVIGRTLRIVREVQVTQRCAGSPGKTHRRPLLF